MVDINKIADEVISELLPEDIQYIKSLNKDDLYSLHHTLGQSIRNKHNFWEIEWTSELIDGVDYSPFHPDNISMTIIEIIHSKLTEV